MALVESSSIRTIRSPEMIPARSAGVPGMGAITVIERSRWVTSIPTPPNSPEVSFFISRYRSGGMKTECGSRAVIIPSTAPKMMASSSMSSA